MAFALNFQGFVRIANVLYNITDDTVKTMINGSQLNTATMRSTNTSTGTISVVKYEDMTTSNNPSLLRLMPQSWKKSGQFTNKRLRNITYQNFNIYEKSNPDGSIKVSPFTGLYYETNMAIRIRSLQRRLFGIWWDNISGRHALSWTFQGNSVTGGAIKNPQGTQPFWVSYSINWSQTNTNGIITNSYFHTTNWNWPSDLNSNRPGSAFNPVHSSGNVHRVNNSNVGTLVEHPRTLSTAGVRIIHN